MKQFFALFCTLFFIQFSIGQSILKDTVTRTALIKFNATKNSVLFTPEVPKLNQVAGAPKAFYTYFWEFGDGNYSKQEKPTHTYKNKGNYKAKLSVTNNYDDGKPPTTRPVEVSIIDNDFDTTQNENHQLLTSFDGFRIQTNRDPVPEEEMQFVLSYGNEKEYPTAGKIYVFFNEKIQS